MNLVAFHEKSPMKVKEEEMKNNETQETKIVLSLMISYKLYVARFECQEAEPLNQTHSLRVSAILLTAHHFSAYQSVRTQDLRSVAPATSQRRSARSRAARADPRQRSRALQIGGAMPARSAPQPLAARNARRWRTRP